MLVPEDNDVLDTTILMIVVYFKTYKFFTCTYLIRQFYLDQALMDNRPDQIQWELVYREIKTDQPIITLYDVVWDDYLSDENKVATGNINKDKFKDVDLMKPAKDPEDEQQERNQALKQLGLGLARNV